MIAFFDTNYGDLAHYLRKHGYRVFGSGKGEDIELDKIGFLDILEKLQLPIAKTYLAEGVDDALMTVIDVHAHYIPPFVLAEADGSDAVAALASRGALGAALVDPATGYGIVYLVEILLLLATVVAIGPLARHARADRTQTRLGLAEMPR